MPIPKHGNSPQSMTIDEKMRIRQAAFQATRLYPGPIGELVSRELLIWEEFGYRIGGHAMAYRLLNYIMSQPLNQEVISNAQ